MHFPARPERYARIQPRTSSSETCAVWPEVAEHAAALGLAVNAWTVALYQPWIVDAYPDCAARAAERRSRRVLGVRGER